MVKRLMKLMGRFFLFLWCMASSSQLSSWEPSPLQGMQGIPNFILLSDHIDTNVNEVCSCPHEGMNLWHLGWFLWQKVWFVWMVCIQFVKTWSPTRLSQMLSGNLWFISNLVSVLVVTSKMHTNHVNHPRCHKFIPSRWYAQTLSMVATMQTESKIKLHRPCIHFKEEYSHGNSPDDDVTTQRKMAVVLSLHWTTLVHQINSSTMAKPTFDAASSYAYLTMDSSWGTRGCP